LGRPKVPNVRIHLENKLGLVFPNGKAETPHGKVSTPILIQELTETEQWPSIDRQLATDIDSNRSTG
jgi:hypothetical protein